MRILLTSLLLGLHFGCASYPKKQGFKMVEGRGAEIINPYFSDTTKDYVYKARIDVFSNSFGGILNIKKLGKLHHRVVFTTEIGTTLFDFEFQGKFFKINRILKEMDKKVLKTLLKRDFLALIKENLDVLSTYTKENNTIFETKIEGKRHYYVYSNSGELKIVLVKNQKENTVHTFSKIQDNQASEIQIVHKKIPLSIRLNAI